MNLQEIHGCYSTGREKSPNSSFPDGADPGENSRAASSRGGIWGWREGISHPESLRDSVFRDKARPGECPGGNSQWEREGTGNTSGNFFPPFPSPFPSPPHSRIWIRQGKDPKSHFPIIPIFPSFPHFHHPHISHHSHHSHASNVNPFIPNPPFFFFT